MSLAHGHRDRNHDRPLRGGKLLFADVSFKLEPRERMTLSGRNGAGKSTLLRVLAGERPPDSGS